MKLFQNIGKLLSKVIILVTFVFVACEPDEKNETNLIDSSKLEQIKRSKVRGEIYGLMQTGYLWYDKIPVNIDTTIDTDVYVFFNNLIYHTFDRWSFMTTKTEMNDIESGIYYGYGIMFALDEYGYFRVAFVYPNTPAESKGIKRGMIVSAINDVKPRSYNHIEELLNQKKISKINFNNSIDVAIQKSKITINPILNGKIIKTNDKAIGYLALESFLGTKIETKLDSLFLLFNTYNNGNGIDELVIDLRYNTGGSIETAMHLANLIVGHLHSGQLFSRIQFNNQIDSLFADTSKVYCFKRLPNSLTQVPTRIFFITSGMSASASEMLIKGLQPYLNVYIIGTKTYGKPVGMIPLDLNTDNYVIVPIMFEWFNNYDQNCDYTGIGVNQPEFDDLSKELGDTSELCLKQAIHYIKYSCFIQDKKNALKYSLSKPDLKGIRFLIGAY